MKWYRIGWKRGNGKWYYITVSTQAEMLAEVADKTTISDKVSVRVVTDRDEKGDPHGRNNH